MADPYECAQRVFAECQAVEKHAYDERLPPPTSLPLDPAALLDVDQARELMASRDPLLLVCRSGRRSRRGLGTLLELGFIKVFALEGGTLAWLARGLPLAPS